MPKAMTLRLSEEKAAELEAVARADDMSVSEAARAAIDQHIKARRSDKAFRTRIRKMMDENQHVLERLAN
jgi:predicted transcriptional regulator